MNFDFRYANLVLESTIDQLSEGRLSDAHDNLSEVVRFKVAGDDRNHAATMMRLVRSAADGGDWTANATKAKMYKLAGAKKASQRAHTKAHANTINAPTLEWEDEPASIKPRPLSPETRKLRDAPTTMRSMKAATASAIPKGDTSTSSQQRKHLVGMPSAHHGFVDPHDPHVQAMRAKDRADFDKYSDPNWKPAKKDKKEDVDLLARFRKA